MSHYQGSADRSSARFKPILLLILAVYLILSLTYLLATPPLEASDEYKHYPVVQYIQSELKLPVLDPQDPSLWLQEAAQPPLYYILMAAITRPIDTDDISEIYQLNPHAFVGNPNQIHNKNLIIHQPDKEAFPWSGSVLAIYIIRFISVLIGLGTILITSRIGLLFFNRSAALLAAALTAFNPMFIFVSASVNNDSLAIFLGTLGSYLLIRIWRDQPGVRWKWWRYVYLGLVIGLGIVTKLSVGGLFLLGAVCVLALAWRRRDYSFLLGGLLILLGALLPALPLAARNMQIYGEPTALSAFIEVQGTRVDAISLKDWTAEFGTFYRSFWGLFGGVNIAAPEIIYHLLNFLTVAGVVGLIRWLWRKKGVIGSQGDLVVQDSVFERAQNSLADVKPGREKSRSSAGLWLLIAWPALLILLLLRWNTIYPAFQGRLIFPAIASINILLAVGLLHLFKPHHRAKAAFSLAVPLVMAAAIIPWIVIRPAYALPEPISEIPEQDRYGPISFNSNGDIIELVGVDLAPAQSAKVGSEPVKLILYWKARTPISKDYLSTVHLLGRGAESIGRINRHPAWGMVPTSSWREGQIWQDEYHVYPDKNAAGPSRLKIKVSLYDTEADSDLLTLGPDGVPIELLIVGNARLEPNDAFAAKPSNKLEIEFDDGIALAGYDVDPNPAIREETIRLTLYWISEFTPSKEYTVFIHLIDEHGNQIGAADSPPLHGDYPTHYWQPGEQIIDPHHLDLPSDFPGGDYTISIGLYDPDTETRLTLLNSADNALRIP